MSWTALQRAGARSDYIGEIRYLQQWYRLIDPAMGEELYEIASMRQFVELSLVSGAAPGETTILNFHHLRERHGPAREDLRYGEGAAVGGWTATSTWHKRRCADHCSPALDHE